MAGKEEFSVSSRGFQNRRRGGGGDCGGGGGGGEEKRQNRLVNFQTGNKICTL